ncbi:MAG: hypothetical protein II336_01975 [Loktanella sp.]|nr:hypothetical protein [Loktanella sp.]
MSVSLTCGAAVPGGSPTLAGGIRCSEKSISLYHGVIDDALILRRIRYQILNGSPEKYSGFYWSDRKAGLSKM